MVLAKKIMPIGNQTGRKIIINIKKILLTLLKNETMDDTKVISISHNRCEIQGKIIVPKAYEYYLSHLEIATVFRQIWREFTKCCVFL